MKAETVLRFLQDASKPRPYRFLHTLIQSEDDAPKCRKHKVEKTSHMFGEQLLVCPECFPAEVQAK